MTTDHLIAAPVVLAGEITGLLDAKINWAKGAVIAAYIVAVAFVALIQFIRSSGSLKKPLMTVVAGIVIYAVMTNVTSLGDKTYTEFNGLGGGVTPAHSASAATTGPAV